MNTSHNPYAETTPQKIGKYEILGMLGRGSSGLVYKGFDPFVRREVAVKMALHLVEEPKHLGGKDAPGNSFFTEARAAGMLNHPYIISLYDAGMEGDLCYIVMEYVDGDTLAPWTRRHGPRMKLPTLVHLMIQCAEALGYSHLRGVLHRDIKPSNIMLMQDGTPKIMDFSIAEVMRGGAENNSNAVGSPLYMAPEQVMRQALTPAADLYALGAVAYQLLTGEPPFMAPHLPGLFNAIRNQPAPDVRELRPDVPVPLAEIINRLLAKKPGERYSSGDELAEALQKVQEHLRVTENLPSEGGNKRDILRQLPFFQRFQAAEFDEIFSVSQLKTYAVGAPLFEDGEAEPSYFLIIRGQALLKKNGKPLYVLQAGDCVADEGELGSKRRVATLTAAAPVICLKLKPAALTRLAEASQLRFYQTFMLTMTQRLGIVRERGSASVRD